MRNSVLGTVLTALLVSVAPPAVAQKVDTIVVANGDRVTGEIVKVERGRLEYKTDDMGTLTVKWDKVRRIWSPFFFEVEISDGRKFFGTLAEPGRDSVVVVSLMQADSLDLLDVVAITPIRRTIWSRMNGLFDAGVTFAQANKALTLTSNLQLQYRGERMAVGIDANTYLQRQDSAAATRRGEVSGNVDHFFRRRWAGTVGVQLQHNEELGLALRTSFTGKVTRTVVQSNRVDVSAGLGLSATNEQFASADTNLGNLEGLVSARLDWFRYDSPKLDLITTVTAFPSLTVKDRVRVELSLRSDYELWKDFFIGLQVRNSFDSNPPDAALTKNDFTVSFTLGWKFNR